MAQLFEGYDDPLEYLMAVGMPQGGNLEALAMGDIGDGQAGMPIAVRDVPSIHGRRKRDRIALKRRQRVVGWGMDSVLHCKAAALVNSTQHSNVRSEFLFRCIVTLHCCSSSFYGTCCRAVLFVVTCVVV